MITKYTEYIKESLSTKQEIISWLDKMNITNYTINKDLSVDVDSNVNINNRNLTKIPIKFNKVSGSFYCSNNNLTSLVGCPTTVNGGFYCHNNKLTNINDLDSKILIKSIKNNIDWTKELKQEVYDKYFTEWIDKDINIVSVLKDKISDKTKKEYNHYFNANNFDLI